MVSMRDSDKQECDTLNSNGSTANGAKMSSMRKSAPIVIRFAVAVTLAGFHRQRFVFEHLDDTGESLL